MNEQKRGYVSLFSSAGVGCYGFSVEGFDCIATSELISRRLDVQKANKVASLPESYVGGDFTLPETKLKVFAAIEKWKATYAQTDIDVVIATPPCQGISVANHKKNDELKRNSLVVESLKLIDQIRPRFFVLENVRGFLNTICTDVDGNDKKIEEAILTNLAGNYNIASKVMNFKDFGSNSSRTRTVVIGVRKDIENVMPYDLFPHARKAPTIRELVGDLKPLDQMGEIDDKDIYHAFRNYDPKMINWIADLKEGQSAFENTDPKKRPHKIVDGKIIFNANKNGDKYSRCYWDNVAPCVHTRNDILASQSTIHPHDNRVFSIRELMYFMTVPGSFKWTTREFKTLNSLSLEEKKTYLKQNEINIRQSLGEAVPTEIFRSIAIAVKSVLTTSNLSLSQVRRLVEKKELTTINSLLNYIDSSQHNFINTARIAELSNAKRLDDGAFYTRQELCFNLVESLPDFKNKKSIRILEPSVGVGNFLPSLFHKYKHVKAVKLDLVDINGDSLRILKKLVKLLDVPRNFEIKFIHDDFLSHNFKAKYDLVVGNPPFGSITAEELKVYKDIGLQSLIKSRNLFALFIEKSLEIAGHVALFSPKSILGAPEFDTLRSILSSRAILQINDYGEKGFSGVKIETISIHISNTQVIDKTIVNSYILRSYDVYDQTYIIDRKFPTWLIYRNGFFDEVTEKITLGFFDVIRDRSLTSKKMFNKGAVKVIKSKNITPEGIVDFDTDQYVKSESASPIAKQYIDRNDIVVAPNLSYYPRASLLPEKVLVDGSAAVLLPRKAGMKLTQEDLNFFASKDYFLFYRIARNYATRSLNIDRNSVFYWGLPRTTSFQFRQFQPDTKRSSLLFAGVSDLFNSEVTL
jgi:DNA (cytosine-5)-methyltransferase 1